MIPTITRAKNAGKRYLNIAPITGVVHPTTTNKENAKISRLAMIPIVFVSIDRLNRKQKIRKILSPHTSVIAGNLNVLPGSPGNGRA